MPSTSITGADALSINGRNMSDFADADFVHLTFPNDRMVVKRSKNGNTIYALNEMGGMADMVMRVLLGSSDDKFLNALLASMESDPASFSLMTGSFSKRVGDGAGVISTVVYQCSGGVFKKRVEAKSSAEGDIEQSVAIYNLQFGNAPKSIQ